MALGIPIAMVEDQLVSEVFKCGIGTISFLFSVPCPRKPFHVPEHFPEDILSSSTALLFKEDVGGNAETLCPTVVTGGCEDTAFGLGWSSIGF